MFFRRVVLASASPLFGFILPPLARRGVEIEAVRRVLQKEGFPKHRNREVLLNRYIRYRRFDEDDGHTVEFFDYWWGYERSEV